jgi:hypothetical protein
MSADALSALRDALAASRAVSIDGDSVVIDGARYPSSAPTSFRSVTKKMYDLGTVTACALLGDLPYPEYMKAARERKVGFVLVKEMAQIFEYLRGSAGGAGGAGAAAGGAGGAGASASAAPTTPSSSSSSSSSTSSRALGVGLTAAAAAASAASAAASLEDLQTIEWAMRKEIPYRTRSNVLECAGSRNLKEEVFQHFTLAWGATAGAGAAAAAATTAAPAGSKRPSSSSSSSSSSSAAAASDAKRARPSSLGPAGAASGPGPALPTVRGTPIIIVPPNASSLLNMYNAQRFFEGGQWVPPEEARASFGSSEKPSKITIKRVDARGNACQYYVTDSVTSLQRHDW